MTVCNYIFYSGLQFWTTLIVFFLVLILIWFFDRKSKHFKIWHFIILFFIGSILIFTFIGMKDSCSIPPKVNFIHDYNSSVNSISDAKFILEGLIREKYENYPYPDKKEEIVQITLNRARETLDGYEVRIVSDCYELHQNGELYSYYCYDGFQ